MAEGFVIDEMVDVAGDEQNGRLVSLTRRLKVSSVTGATPQAAVAAILTDPGIPAAGSSITVNGSVRYLVGRKPKMTESHDLAEVDLFYEGGTVAGGSTGEVSRGGDVALSQIRSKYDREGNEIVVQLGDAIFVRTQRAEISVLMPEAAPWIETIEATSDPDALAAQWAGRVNSSAWRGKEAGKWIVARVRWREITANLWRFFWQFQESSEDAGWLPVVAYIDPETNRMPEGLVEGTGIKTIPWYYTINFNSKFA